MASLVSEILRITAFFFLPFQDCNYLYEHGGMKLACIREFLLRILKGYYKKI